MSTTELSVGEPRPPQRPALRLLFVSGSRAGSDLTIDTSPAAIGRSSACDVRLDSHADGLVSARHASLTHREGAWWIEDLNSRNGTYVGTERLDAPHRLRADDEISLGPPESEGSVKILIATAPSTRRTAPPPDLVAHMKQVIREFESRGARDEARSVAELEAEAERTAAALGRAAWERDESVRAAGEAAARVARAQKALDDALAQLGRGLLASGHLGHVTAWAEEARQAARALDALHRAELGMTREPDR